MRGLSLILVCFAAIAAVFYAERSLAQAGYGAAEAAYDAAMLECSLPVFPFYDITVNKLSDRDSFQMTEEKAAFLKKCMKERGFSYEASVSGSNYYQSNRSNGDVGDDGLTDKERNNIRRYYQQQLTGAGLSEEALPRTVTTDNVTPEVEEIPETTRRLYNYSGQKPDDKKPGSLWLRRN